MYRIDLTLALEETYADEVRRATFLKKFDGGRTVDMTIAYMENLVKAGVDIFDVDMGCYDNWWMPHPPSSMPAGCFLELSKKVKEHFAAKQIKSNAGYEVPIVGVGKLGYPDIAEQALRDGACDMVMLGRPLLADPEWPNKTFAGKVPDIRPCIGCQEGCLNEFVEGGHPQCAVNPRTSFEFQIPEIPAQAETKKKIAVIGAGPGGTIAALTCVRRGHTVDLYEKDDKVGGRMLTGSVSRVKYEVDNYRQYLEHTVNGAVAEGGLKLLTGTRVSAAELKGKGYDAIIVATGTSQIDLKLGDGVKTIQAVDLFDDPSLLGEAQNIVVIGGGVVGCEAAQWLSFELGRKVTVLEMLEGFMHGSCTANRGHLIHALRANGVKLINCAKVTSVKDGAVHYTRNTHKNVPDPYNTWSPILPENIENPLAPKVLNQPKEESIACDLVVYAAGGRADSTLYREAVDSLAAAEIYNIGDSFAAGKIKEAVRAGYRLAVTI